MALTLPAPLGPPHAALQRHQLALHVRRQVHTRRAGNADRAALAFLVAVARVGRSEHLLRSRRVPAPRPFFKVVPYLDFSLIPSIIAFICGCRSPIICIIADIERCITSGIF